MLPVHDTEDELRARGLAPVPTLGHDGWQHKALVQRLQVLGVPMFLRPGTRDEEVWVSSAVVELVESRFGGLSDRAARLVVAAVVDLDDPLSTGTELAAAYLLGGRDALLGSLPPGERAEEVRRLAEADERALRAAVRFRR